MTTTTERKPGQLLLKEKRRCECKIEYVGPNGPSDAFIQYCYLHRAAPALLEAVKAALAHVEELSEAWERGALSEHDGHGGTRSNRNQDVYRQLQAAIAATKDTA